MNGLENQALAQLDPVKRNDAGWAVVFLAEVGPEKLCASKASVRRHNLPTVLRTKRPRKHFVTSHDGTVPPQSALAGPNLRAFSI